MSDPYREAAGIPCVRCKEPLAPDDAEGVGELVCMNGCGRWLPDASVAQMFPAEWLADRAVANPFHAKVLPWCSCPLCGQSLQTFYAGFPTPITLNRCVGHGTWVDDPVRDHFLEVYADSIREVLDAKALAGESAALVTELAAGRPDAFRALVDRIAALEARIAKLEARRG